LTLQEIAITGQSIANVRHKNAEFEAIAEKVVQSRLAELSTIRDACFLGDSFAKLKVPNKKLFQRIEEVILQNTKQIRLDQLKQLLSSGRNHDFYSDSFYKGILTTLNQKLDNPDRPITNGDARYFLKFVKMLGNKTKEDMSTVYDKLNSIIAIPEVPQNVAPSS
jgi:hypothetical protein